MMNPYRAAGATRGASAYSRVGVESDVMSASPHRLISLLFDGADSAIRAAAIHLRDGNVVEKGKSISRALDIVNNGLLAALDRERGGELAGNMASLYEYIARLLLRANLRDDLDALEEAGRLLGDLAGAWREIDPQREQGAP